MKKKTISMLMGITLSFTTVFGAVGPLGVTVSAAAEEGVTDAECSEKNTAAPEADDVIPDANQYKYQKDELAAFCHFGPNTFNEVEWGESYGSKSPADIFTLSNDFDADTLVRTLQNAGFKKLIVTAKHHDGFCIWASAYTTYDVSSTKYKNGQGDILAEISAACTKYDMDMGLYLSPWDIHEPSYGYYDSDGNATTKENDVLDYNEYYNNQLTEILGSKKYGNNGHFVEVWMDGAKGSGANAQEYDFNKWFATIQKYEGKAAGYDADCLLFGAKAYTTVRWIGNENGLAYEDTWSKSKADLDANTLANNEDSTNTYTIGFEDGNKWTVPECDGRITSGWFWGTKKCTPKSVSDLANMYFGSVGHNAVMLLNVPPNNKGTVDTAILNRVEEFGENIRDTFQKNLAQASDAVIEASSVRGNDTAFKPGNTVDADDDTYWTTDDGSNSGSLTVKWNTAKTFDVVSLEEAIQNGQHINSYKIEYKTDDDSQWQTLKSGVTVGAKRLVRTAPVSAKQVRITVGTTSGKVPMLSEVGIYKASKGFQLSGAMPEGMETTSVNDAGMKFSATGWNPQTGSQYINGQNTYSNVANATMEFSFTGSKIYLLGTKDPGHGEADIYIDDVLVGTINTKASSRATGVSIFESDDLDDKEHILKLVTKTNAAIGIEAAAVINNGGAGMIELENSEYTMNEDSELEMKLKRIGGTKGDVTVRLQPNPGSAIQDDFDTEMVQDVTFKDGESEKTLVVAKTRRNTNKTGNRVFTIEMEKASEDSNVIIGFNGSAKITILDSETIASDSLKDLVSECSSLYEHAYVSGWQEFAKVLTEAKSVLENENSSVDQMTAAYDTLKFAKEALVAREKYTEADPAVFPDEEGSSEIIEAEFATEVINSQESDSDPNWPMTVVNGQSWASNGGFVNCMAYKDVLKYAYKAEKPGIYTITGTYRSGALNKVTFSDEAGRIDAVTAECPSTKINNNLTVSTFSVDILVKEAGEGVLVLTPPSGFKGPQLDKLEVTLKVAKHTEDNRFVFPMRKGQSVVLEAESAELVNTGTNESYPLQIAKGSWAGNGWFVNCMNSGDKIKIPYHAEVAGTYKFTATYRSGGPSNKYTWSDEAGNITAGECQAGSSDVSQTRATEFEVEVTNPGNGVLVFTAPPTNSAQTDKFDVELVSTKVKETEIEVTAPTKCIYGIGEALDLSGMQVSVKDSNGNTTVLNADQYTVSNPDLSETGEKTLTVTYEGVEQNFTADITMQVVDRDSLEKAIDQANAVKSNGKKYTRTTTEALDMRLAAANVVLNDIKAANAEEGASKVTTDIDAARVAAASSELTAAVENLEQLYKISVPTAATITAEEGAESESGSDSDVNWVYVPVLTKVTVTAPEIQNSQKFVGWKWDKNVISTSACYIFYVVEDMDLTTDYSNVTIEDETIRTLLSTSWNNSARKRSFTVKRSVPKKYTVVEHGVVITDQQGWEQYYNGNEEDFKKYAIRTKRTKSTSTANNGTFVAKLACKTKSEKWYARAYVSYQNTDGSVKTYYSDILTY
jgi:alpha-L-fucosidase